VLIQAVVAAFGVRVYLSLTTSPDRSELVERT